MKDRILDFLDPSRSIPLFIIGTAALSLGLQALYDSVNDPTRFQGGYLLAIASLLVAVGVLITTWQMRKVPGRIVIQDELKPYKRKGLILMAGPTEASAPHAINYHLPTLQHCWIIATNESIKTAALLAERYHDRGPKIHWDPSKYIVDPDQLQDMYNMVIRIAGVEILDTDLKPEDLIADITGGTKPMTAGMGLACLARNLDMEYMKAPRDEKGRVIEGAIPEPIRIDTTFVPATGLHLI